jgi:SP family sugar:H+ symporter-like MFS transporter
MSSLWLNGTTGYDSGYINGVLGMDFFKCRFSDARMELCIADPSGHNIAIWQKSLITSILSAGTFLGALAAGSLADTIGRRPSIILACLVFAIGVIIQTASSTVGVLVAGRVVAGLGVGVISATVILYMSEIAPRRIRGALVATYQFAITVGILLAACVAQGTKDRKDSGSYRIPIALQMFWAIILAVGLFLLPESPRYWVKRGHTDKATASLVRIRGEPADSDIVQIELADILANYEYEMSISSSNWSDCLRGGLKPSGNLYRVFVGTALQMFQQLTGVNFM